MKLIIKNLEQQIKMLQEISSTKGLTSKENKELKSLLLQLEEINKLNKDMELLKSQELENLSKKDKTKLSNLEKLLEKIRLEHDQWKVSNLSNRKTSENKEKTNLKSTPSYYELIKNFIITILTNLLSFALIKYILKRTVPLYLEKLVSYVVMGVVINNIFGGYLAFIYGIICELINQSESAKAFFSIFGLTTFSDWFKAIIQHFKDFFTNLRKDSTGVNLEKLNKENGVLFEKQLEIDKLNRRNEILEDKLDDLTRKVEEQERISVSKESRSWSDFFRDFGKDLGITAYNSVKFILITGLVRYTIESITKNEELNKIIKNLISKYFDSSSENDEDEDPMDYSTTDILDQERERQIDRAINSDFVNKSTQTDFEENDLNSNIEATQTDFEENDLSSSIETVKPTKTYQDNSTQTIDNSGSVDNHQTKPLPPSPIINDSKELSNDNITSKNQEIDNYLLSEEYNNKAIQFNNNSARLSEIEIRTKEIENELNGDFKDENVLMKELNDLIREIAKLKNENLSLNEEISSEIRKYSNKS